MFKKKYYILIITIFLSLTTLLFSIENQLYQVSTIDALLLGTYDGEVSLKNLKEKGNFGIGTFDGLDGEMLMLDSKIYQIKADGKVYEPLDAIFTPFASVCQFNPDFVYNINKKTDFDNLKKFINTKIKNKNLFIAFKIKGSFRSIKTRSVPKQTKPYPPLSSVTKNQPEFFYENLSGTIVGFYCPEFVKGVNIPGYHFHFLSDDLKKGGHVLEFELSNASIEIDILNKFLLDLPIKNKDFQSLDLSKDLSEELKKVEQ